MGKNTSISLGSHFEEFVNEKISEGRYKNASEVIRAGLRLLENDEQQLELLRSALEKGVNSGFVNNFDPDEHLKTLRENRRKANG